MSGRGGVGEVGCEGGLFKWRCSTLPSAPHLLRLPCTSPLRALPLSPDARCHVLAGPAYPSPSALHPSPCLSCQPPFALPPSPALISDTMPDRNSPSALHLSPFPYAPPPCALPHSTALILDTMFWPFLAVAFLYFVLFAALEMRHIVLVWRAQRAVLSQVSLPRLRSCLKWKYVRQFV